MSTDEIVVLGFEVVGNGAKKGYMRRLSGRFTVREAADECAALWRKVGHPEAYVRVIHGFEGKRGHKREAREP